MAKEWTGLGTAVLKIDADASGVADGVKKAEGALGKLGDSVKSQDENLKKYGDKLGKSFGPGEGLQGKLGKLETPLRDTEGAIARSQMAFVEFGKAGATASDKVGAGFLLLSDGIAAFGSGGPAGIAIAAAVAGISLLVSKVMAETAASEAAAEAQKVHAAALSELASAAVEAGVSIAALESEKTAAASLANVRAVEQENIDARLKRRKLKDQVDEAAAAASKAPADRTVQGRQGGTMVIRSAESRLLKELTADLEAQDAILETMSGKALLARKDAKEAQVLYQSDLKVSRESEVTSFIENLKATKAAAVKVMNELSSSKAGASGPKGDGDAEKIANERLKEIEADRRLDLKVAADNKAFDRSEAADAAAFDAEMLAAKKLGEEEFLAWKRTADKKAADDAIERGRKAQESFMKVNAVQIAATRAIIGGLQQMAHDGEISFAALGDAAMTAAGNQLVASGTEHLLGGAAKAFAGAATFNPVMVAGGTAEAGQGALMIAAGLGLGAVGGAIGRSGAAPAAPSGASAPTDSRESRAASGGSGGEGGSTIIHFNGPAYDRRGIANVLTSGNRMARHRRIAGA